MEYTLDAYRERIWNKADKFRRLVDEFMQLCDYIEEIEECEDCPMNLYCFKDTSVEEIWSDVSVSRLADFMEYADEMESKHTDPYFSQENWDDYQANESRQDF